MKILWLLVCLFLYIQAEVDFLSQKTIEERQKESELGYQHCLRIAQLYALPKDCNFKDITNDILEHRSTSKEARELIKNQNRTIVLFEYPSDGYCVKATLSYTPEVETAPLLLFLRGGSRIFGLMHPASSVNLLSNYTIIAPTYRGGVSGGQDEFGGDEVNDIKYLVDYIPQLEKQLGFTIRPMRKYIWGASRGGMEMFLALARYPYLQDWFDKSVSLSGLLDMRIVIKYRERSKNMFINDFGLKGEDDMEWIRRRNPVEQCKKIKSNFPILIIQGTEDNRTHILEGRNMVRKLEELGKNVTYWEIEGGTHCLGNIQTTCNQMIVEWLEL